MTGRRRARKRFSDFGCKSGWCPNLGHFWTTAIFRRPPHGTGHSLLLIIQATQKLSPPPTYYLSFNPSKTLILQSINKKHKEERKKYAATFCVLSLFRPVCLLLSLSICELFDTSFHALKFRPLTLMLIIFSNLR